MKCRVCDGTNLEPMVDLGDQPWANHFLPPEDVGKEPLYPLRVVYCHSCTTMQLDHTIPKEVMFGNHTYLSGITSSLKSHFRQVAEETTRRLSPDQSTVRKQPSVLDIGSNDGTQLRIYQDLGFDVLGVESSAQTARLANDAGISTLNRFFNQDLAESLKRKFDVINAAGVFFHLEELNSVTRGIKTCLAPGGIFVVQFLYMKSITENVAFDQIYHEHLLYYNLHNLNILLRRHGLALFDATFSPIHGGSIVGFVGHEGERKDSEELRRLRHEEWLTRCNEAEYYRDFARRIEEVRARNLAFLRQAKQQGKTIYGMGAPVKGNTLLNYFQVGPDTVDFLVEKNTLRKGLYSPGMHIPVILEDEVQQTPDVYYVLAWNFRKEILANNQDLLKKGVEFYFPIETKAA